MWREWGGGKGGGGGKVGFGHNTELLMLHTMTDSL